MKILVQSLILITSICIFSACAAQNDRSPIHAEKIHTGQNCNISDATSAIWINSPQQLESILKQAHSHILNPNVTVPKVDFTRYGVIAVSMGLQRTGGYGLALSNSPININGDTATLKLNWRQPAKGMITIQMLTSPCLLVKINKGGIKNLQIVTLTGKKIASLTIP